MISNFFYALHQSLHNREIPLPQGLRLPEFPPLVDIAEQAFLLHDLPHLDRLVEGGLGVLEGIERRGEYLFSNGATGTHIKSIRKSFDAALKAAKIPGGRENGLVFHDLRHIAASQLVKVIDVVTASRILGHSSIEMTMRYAHPTPENMQRAVDKLGEILRGGREKVESPAQVVEIRRPATRSYLYN
jgi:integrase